MADNLDTDKSPLKTSAKAELDGVEIPAKHAPETYALIDQAKEERRDWSVQWGAKPEKDSRAEDEAAAMRERNNDLVKPYLPKADLTDEKTRVRNLMHIKDFCAKLHRILGPASDGGSRIFINTPPATTALDNKKMKGLFVKMRGMDNFLYHLDLMDSLGTGWKKICAIQTPYMSEWGIMHLDDRGMFKGWKYIGWRGQVLLRLILAEAITEEEAHREFGIPQGDEVDREYLKILEGWRRNGKRTN